MTPDEAATVRQLADLTGRSRREIVRLVSRTELARMRFALAVQLVTGQWAWLDGATGQWSIDGSRQREKLQRYADSLTEEEPCAGSSPSN